VWWSVLQCVAVSKEGTCPHECVECDTVGFSVLQCVAVWCIPKEGACPHECVTVCYSVL